MVFSFVDFGKGWKVYDKDGIEPEKLLIESISKSNPGLVKVLKEKPHGFKTGDFVRIYEVEGMIEVNGTDTRPVKVVDDYT